MSGGTTGVSPEVFHTPTILSKRGRGRHGRVDGSLISGLRNYLGMDGEVGVDGVKRRSYLVVVS